MFCEAMLWRHFCSISSGGFSCSRFCYWHCLNGKVGGPAYVDFFWVKPSVHMSYDDYT